MTVPYFTVAKRVSVGNGRGGTTEAWQIAEAVVEAETAEEALDNIVGAPEAGEGDYMVVTVHALSRVKAHTRFETVPLDVSEVLGEPLDVPLLEVPGADVDEPPRVSGMPWQSE